ncbi:1-(5-phosphoribosyl)-5-[(5-phosphoribosylamino)methylideneamino]imidazole-4-carboxamide isomerase [Ferrimonas lipolytica]|uniref:1-(5-phosphoribosyl)-5-[(5-phosphoribosylamino)methylideneamino] imidazole-4-carboxamide isomerase n=1 Tax=Ferrimonas lipolytica TaxID=2724191 RepID=A0A6H1UCI6_9GAMM|nr:1-(5-phosphoribosyl)-5-[(5-phosphoribosylamino)methylideneamino]imidazole-4-carboxamide isomerase [Ferrimonas lipolytica]QIZ76754.1 1-(5-phosphoribosyl)-5-[(5-phosphoribosylamino)methylideneamino]imidazole-4-carboxamide isomerase [Ferrimonas lipolytica]
MIIPAIDLINGQVVRLQKGDFDKVTNFAFDPIEQLLSYQNAGSEHLHLVDLDGARNPVDRQLDAIANIAAALDAPIQVGGGIRTQKEVETLLELGVNRVVIGSLAVKEPQLVASWLEQYGAEHITIALDVLLDADGNPEVLTNGWQQGSGKRMSDAVEPLLAAGMKHVLCTDVDRDGMMFGPNFDLYYRLRKQFPMLQWQASGGIHALDDLAKLKQLKVGGVIIGKALLSGKFTCEEALACWQNA